MSSIRHPRDRDRNGIRRVDVDSKPNAIDRFQRIFDDRESNPCHRIRGCSDRGLAHDSVFKLRIVLHLTPGVVIRSICARIVFLGARGLAKRAEGKQCGNEYDFGFHHVEGTADAVFGFPLQITT